MVSLAEFREICNKWWEATGGRHYYRYSHCVLKSYPQLKASIALGLKSNEQLFKNDCLAQEQRIYYREIFNIYLHIWNILMGEAK